MPGGSAVKNLPAMQETRAGDVDLTPGSGRSVGEGNGNPLQYSCLENPSDRGAWQALQFMGLQRIGHDVVTEQQQHTQNDYKTWFLLVCFPLPVT